MSMEEIFLPTSKFFTHKDITRQQHKEIVAKVMAMQVPLDWDTSPQMRGMWRNRQIRNLEDEILDKLQYDHDKIVWDRIMEATKECCICHIELKNEGCHVIKNGKAYCTKCA